MKTHTESREYWIVTVRPDGRPHAMIIWGLWLDDAFWFGTGRKTQKALNLARNSNCVVGTQNGADAVILVGVAELITDASIRKKLEPTSLNKYGMSGGDALSPFIVCAQAVCSASSKRAFRKLLRAGHAIEVRECKQAIALRTLPRGGF